MRDDIEFCIVFIKEVEKHPVLYNTQHPDYGNTRQMQLAWKKIGHKFKENDIILRKKWKMIRSSYTRAHKVKTSGGKREYYLSKYLEFIRPFMKPRMAGVSGVALDTSDEDYLNYPQDDEEDNEDSDEDPTEDFVLKEESPPQLDESANIALIRMREEEQDPMFIDVKREEESPDREEPQREPCEMYLLSLVPHIKTMNLRQQLQFERGVIDLIEKIKYGD